MKLKEPTQLSLWGDDLCDAHTSAVSVVQRNQDPLTSTVSPLSAPPQTSSFHPVDLPLRGVVVPVPDDEAQPSTPTGRPSTQPQYECHPSSGLPWFRHPQAEREIRLTKAIVAYEVKRAHRGSIGMVVGVEGLSVRAPRWVSPIDIETALRAKERWICNKLVEQRERAHKQLSAQIEWREGATVPYLGDAVVLVLDPRVVGAVLQDAVGRGEPSLPGVAQRALHLGLPQHATSAQIRQLVHTWLQAEALRIFLSRVPVFSEQLSVSVRKVSLSSAKTRWGSASADGSIRLHWRLIHFSIGIIDYVVAHELAHLREMNHSPRFWDVVRSVLPEFDGAREHLRRVVIPD